MKMNRISSCFCCTGISCVTSGCFKHCTLESVPVISLEVETKLVCPVWCRAGFLPGLPVLRVHAKLLPWRCPPRLVCKLCNRLCRGSFHWKREMRKPSKGCSPGPLGFRGGPRRRWWRAAPACPRSFGFMRRICRQLGAVTHSKPRINLKHGV